MKAKGERKKHQNRKKSTKYKEALTCFLHKTRTPLFAFAVVHLVCIIWKIISTQTQCAVGHCLYRIARILDTSFPTFPSRLKIIIPLCLEGATAVVTSVVGSVTYGSRQMNISCQRSEQNCRYLLHGVMEEYFSVGVEMKLLRGDERPPVAVVVMVVVRCSGNECVELC